MRVGWPLARLFESMQEGVVAFQGIPRLQGVVGVVLRPDDRSALIRPPNSNHSWHLRKLAVCNML